MGANGPGALQRMLEASAERYAASTALAGRTTAVAWGHLTLAGGLAWLVESRGGPEQRGALVVLLLVTAGGAAAAIWTRGFRTVDYRSLALVVGGIVGTWVGLDLLIASASFQWMVVAAFVQLMLALTALRDS